MLKVNQAYNICEQIYNHHKNIVLSEFNRNLVSYKTYDKPHLYEIKNFRVKIQISGFYPYVKDGINGVEFYASALKVFNRKGVYQMIDVKIHYEENSLPVIDIDITHSNNKQYIYTPTQNDNTVRIIGIIVTKMLFHVWNEVIFEKENRQLLFMSNILSNVCRVYLHLGNAVLDKEPILGHVGYIISKTRKCYKLNVEELIMCLKILTE